MNLPIEVLFSDGHLLAVNKPGGLPAQPDLTGDPSLLDRLKTQYDGTVFGLPHRLDRPVSGVVLLTRTPESLAAISAVFAQRGMRKMYWAIVHGSPPSVGIWEHHLAHDARARKSRVTDVAEAHTAAKLRFRRLAQGERYALLELVPEGGHFHQLRAQCAAAGHPIKGDVKYGARRGEPDRTIALHARSLAFVHPFTRADVRIEAPSPDGVLWRALFSLADPGGA